MELAERLELYQSMVLCCHRLYLWEFDPDLKLLHSGCPEEAAVNNIFSFGNTLELFRASLRHRMPTVITGDIGWLWISIPVRSGEAVTGLYVLGPFFSDDAAARNAASGINGLRLSASLTQSMRQFVHDLPVVTYTRAFEYAMMLYHCITGGHIAVSNLHYLSREQTQPRSVSSAEIPERHGTYELEQEMVRLVREGDLNYRRHMDRLAVTGALGKLSNGDQFRQMKNAVFVCIILFSRAAIEGGLSPELALTLTDRYFQGVESCRNLAELSELNTTMQEDFVQRVHRCRSSKLSKPIQQCCDYIQLHADEEISLKALAERLRYSEQYLCRKFKQETGENFKDYICRQRLEQAKALLQDPAISIREISERLHFCTSSYFSERFKAAYGTSPSQWREARAAKQNERSV